MRLYWKYLILLARTGYKSCYLLSTYSMLGIVFSIQQGLSRLIFKTVLTEMLSLASFGEEADELVCKCHPTSGTLFFFQ